MANKGGTPKNLKPRASTYKPEYDQTAYKLCLLGCTDEELATFFEIHVDTIYEWKKKHQSFTESINKGKQIADADVAVKLFERATGYQHDDEDIRVIEGEIVKTPIKKHYPPDPASMIYWMNNRQRGKWKQKQSEEEQAPVIISVNVTKAETVSIGQDLMSEVFGKQ